MEAGGFKTFEGYDFKSPCFWETSYEFHKKKIMMVGRKMCIEKMFFQ